MTGTVRCLLGVAVLCGLLSGRPAEASEGLAALGVSTVAGATTAHAVMWSLNDSRQSGMAVHFIPIAGPVVGLREARSPTCDAVLGCPALTIADGFLLGMQIGGLALTTAAVVVDHDGRLRAQVTPQGASVSLRW